MAQAASALKQGSIKFPELEREYRHSTGEQMDAALAALNARKDAWVSLPIEERILILKEIADDLTSIGREWVELSLRGKEDGWSDFKEGVEWGSFWPMLRAIRLVRMSLEDIRDHGQPRIPGPVWTKPDGQVAALVFPQTWWERLLFIGIRGEVWMDPDMSREDVLERQAQIYKHPPSRGAVSAVLGAGNVGFLAFAQVIHKLFFQMEVVALKLNPVNEYLGPLFERGMRSPIQRGFLRIVYGGASEGAYMTHHAMVDTIHMIGSDKTFDAIVFGPGEEGLRRKAHRDPVLGKPIEAELGNVSPVIIVPGQWSEGDLDYVAKQIASWQTFNSGFYCLTPRVLIQMKGWEHRHDLLQRVGDVFAEVQPTRAYYPGAQRIHAAFMDAHPEALTYGSPDPDQLPWTLIPDVDPDQKDDIAFTTEAFCSLTAETALEAPDIPSYLERAVDFANEDLWGTLNATIMVHPRSLKDPAVEQAVEGAIEKLEYGTVCVNYFPGVAVCFTVLPWGGYPHNDIYDIQSGFGTLNNSLMFDRPQKAVLRAPFRRYPDPFLTTARGLATFTRRLAHFDVAPRLWKLPGVILSALKS